METREAPHAAHLAAVEAQDEEGHEGQGNEQRRCLRRVPQDRGRDQRDARRDEGVDRAEAEQGSEVRPLVLRAPDDDRDVGRGEQIRGHRGGKRREPADRLKWIRPGDDEPENQQRHACAQREVADVEEQLDRPLAGSKGEGTCSECLAEEEIERSREDQSQDEGYLAERERVRLLADLEVDDEALGDEEEHRQQRPGQRDPAIKPRIGQDDQPQDRRRAPQAGDEEPYL